MAGGSDSTRVFYRTAHGSVKRPGAGRSSCGPGSGKISAVDAPLDTGADAYRAQIEAFRRMGGTGRAAVMFRLNELARKTALAGIRSRHPEYDEEQQRLALGRLILGDELARKVWPDHALVEP